MTALLPATMLPAVPCRGGCGQRLTDADSIRVGMGPDCAAQHGVWHPRNQTTTRPAAVRQDGPSLLDLIGDRDMTNQTASAPAESGAEGSAGLSAHPSSPQSGSGDLSGLEVDDTIAELRSYGHHYTADLIERLWHERTTLAAELDRVEAIKDRMTPVVNAAIAWHSTWGNLTRTGGEVRALQDAVSGYLAPEAEETR